MTSMTAITERATELAQQNTPGVAFAKLGVFLENVFLGTLRLLGLIVGRTWFHFSRLIFVIGLAIYGRLQRRCKGPATACASSAGQHPYPAGAGFSVEDPRTIDAYQTPFGVPSRPEYTGRPRPVPADCS